MATKFAKPSITATKKPSTPKYQYIVNGRFRILQIVGEGSQGKVYKVEDCQENNRVKALKEVRVISKKDFDSASRECNILQKINSEFIVKYLEYYDDLKNSFFYILTEFYEDGTLDQLITLKKKTKETIPYENILLWSTQLLKGIDCLHTNYITHRDLKPANVFLHRNNIVLGDLGLARDAEMMSRQSLAKGVGTVSYMAPELFSDLTFTDKIDIWAYGCIIYEMIKMKALFEGTIWRILNSIHNFKSERNLNIDNIPDVFRNILRRTIVKNPQQRAATKELLDLLASNNSCLTCNGVSKPPAPSFTETKPVILNNIAVVVSKPKGGSIDKLISVFQPQSPTTVYASPAVFRKSAISSPPIKPSSIGETQRPTSAQVLTNNDILFSGSADKTIKFWNIQTGACVQTLSGHTNDVRCLQMIGNDILASGSDDKTIKLWKIKTSECIRTLAGHDGSVYCLQQLVNQTTKESVLISGSGDETIKIWNVNTGECVATLRGHEDSVKSIQVVSDELIISGSDDKTIKIWNIKSQNCLNTVSPRHTKFITCLEVLSNDILISGSWDCTIKLWSIKTGECLKTLTDHTSYVTCLQALSSEVIISGSRDATIKIWNINTGECLNTLKGHNSTIFCLRVTLFKDILFSGSSDTIKVWNIKTGRCINTLEGHSDHIRCLFI